MSETNYDEYCHRNPEGARSVVTLRSRVAELEANEVKLRNLYDYVAVELHKAEVERDSLREALDMQTAETEGCMKRVAELGNALQEALIQLEQMARNGDSIAPVAVLTRLRAALVGREE